MQTLADFLLAAEREYDKTAIHSRSAKRRVSAWRSTCSRLSEMLRLPLESVYLNDLVESEERLIAYIDSLGITHQTAVQYACETRKMLDFAHELGWPSSRAYELRRSWMPIRLALKNNSHGNGGLVKFAIKQDRMPAEFTAEDMDKWKESMLGRGLSLLSVVCYESYFRTTMRGAGLKMLFPNFSLASKNPPMYRLQYKDLPASLRNEIQEVIQWKTDEGDIDDRDACLIIRPVTAAALSRHFVELYSYAVKILEIEEITCLRQLISETIICGFIDWLQEDDRCRSASVIQKLSGIHFLTRTYPKLKLADDGYRWFRTKLDTLRKEKNGYVQTRKLDGIPDYESVAEIAPKLLALRDRTNQLSELEVAWLIHDALIFTISLLTGYRSRNIREAGIHPREQLNIFETEITSELLSQIKLPAWAKQRRDQDSRTKFLVCHWVESQTKGDHEVWELFPHEAIPLFRQYVDEHRPILLRGSDPNSSSLFFARNGMPLTQKSLLNLVTSISVRHTGKRLTVKLFRDLVAAHMLANGANLEEAATRLWQLDPYTTTARHYVAGYNTSDAMIVLEDELTVLMS
jgi:hypothetical protein